MAPKDLAPVGATVTALGVLRGVTVAQLTTTACTSPLPEGLCRCTLGVDPPIQIAKSPCQHRNRTYPEKVVRRPRETYWYRVRIVELL